MEEKKVKNEDTANKDEKKKVDQDDVDATEVVKATPVVKKSKKRQILKGQAHIQCTYNNTIITITDMSGGSLGWSSAGFLGFKGAKKSTPYAATKVAGDVSEKIQKFGVKELNVFIKGVGGGRESSIRGLANAGFNLTSIKDITPVPHNGCRPKKPRRV